MSLLAGCQADSLRLLGPVRLGPMSARERPTTPPPAAAAVGMVWNRFGWFGSQVGGSVWILLLAGLLAMRGDPQAAAAVVLVFAVANLVGWRLWILRRRRAALAGHLWLVLVLAAAAALAFGVTMASPALELPGFIFLYLLVFPLVAAMLVAIDAGGRRAHARRLYGTGGSTQSGKRSGS